jgi:hypothetical protein
MTKKFVLGLVALMMVMALCASNNVRIARLNQTNQDSNRNREEIQLYQETFEDGAGNWTSFDGTVPSSMWHISDLANAEGITPQGTHSWWMGDEEIGGYPDEVYVVLDTPVINSLPASTHLTFKLAYACETPGTSGNYNGWDGCDIRISTNGGTSWTVISGTPAYNCSSMFSFGDIHGEGVNVPGWGGSSNGWVDANFDLSAYAGQNVMIRFAFASDGAYNTNDDDTLFGMIVDNIVLSTFSNDAEAGQGDMVISSVVPVGGDIWHVGTDDQASSPTHVMACQNDAGSYNPSLLDYVTSPVITLPNADDVRTDLMVDPYLYDTNIDDADPPLSILDYWGWEVSVDGGATWHAMSNPYGDPNGSNYVFTNSSDADGGFNAASESYNELDGYISDYAGQDVMFRVYVSSDSDTPIGNGFRFDDYVVYYTAFLPPPTELTAQESNRTVVLNWTSPFAGGGQEGWLQWDNNSIGTSQISMNNEEITTVYAANRFTGEDLVAYSGGQISQMMFVPLEDTPHTLYIWSGASGQTVEMSQVVSTVTVGSWNTITLTTPITLAIGQTYWFGYSVNSQSFGACDSGPMVVDRGAYVHSNLSSNWTDLVASSGGDLDYNWCIRAYVEQPVGGRTVLMPHRDLLGFKVYRSATAGEMGDSLTVVDPNTTTYTDLSPVGGALNYYQVTSVFDAGESAATSQVSVYIMNETSYEYGYDDGSADSTYTPGVQNYAIVRISPNVSDEHTAHFKLVKFYLTHVSTQNMVLKCWRVGDTGLPSTTVFSKSLDYHNFAEGWNSVILPDSVVTGDFFIGLMGTSNSSTIGIDTSAEGHSYYGTIAQLAPLPGGEFMIRTIVDLGYVGTDDDVAPARMLTASNYPNPFNPETTIEMSLPLSGKASLKVYNMRGQLVRTLADGQMTAGKHTITWNGRDNQGRSVASGLYFYRVESNGQAITRKTMMMK